MHINRDTLHKLWPHASSDLVYAIASTSQEVFTKHGITTALRAAHFMAQISHESGGGTIKEESLNYTTPARIAAVWPSRFTQASAREYTRNPKKLANKVYNGRMGNKVGTDDGYNYRGRGLLQITGRESYREIGKLCGLDLENEPDLAYKVDTTLEVAVTEFVHLKCLPACDADNVRLVTKRVNGGYIGLSSREAWLTKWKRVLNDSEEDGPEFDPRKGDDLPKRPTMDSKTVAAVATAGVAGATETLSTINDTLTTVQTTVTPIAQTANDTGFTALVMPYLHMPMFWVGLVIILAAAFVVWDRHRQIKQDHV